MRYRTGAVSSTVLAAACVAAAFSVGGAPASGTQPAAGVTLTLVSPGPCTAPAKVVGRACLVSGHLLDPTWTLSDGSARWNVPGRWQSSYTWKVPATIPPAGASMTMTLAATELTGGAGALICPAMGVAGGVELKVGGVSQAQPVGLGFCAEAGGSRSGTKTVKLVPSSAQPPGTFVYLLVGLQDGGEFTYRYRAGAAAPMRCPAPPRIVAQADDGCTYRVQWKVVQKLDDDPINVSSYGTGSFRVELPSGGSRFEGTFCSPESLATLHHRDDYLLKGDAIVILRAGPGRVCVTFRVGKGEQPIAARVTLPVDVYEVLSGDGCPVGSTGEVVIRDGKPFDFVVIDVCNHRHVFSPSKPGAEQNRTVDVRIRFSP